MHLLLLLVRQKRPVGWQFRLLSWTGFSRKTFLWGGCRTSLASGRVALAISEFVLVITASFVIVSFDEEVQKALRLLTILPRVSATVDDGLAALDKATRRLFLHDIDGQLRCVLSQSLRSRFRAVPR